MTLTAALSAAARALRAGDAASATRLARSITDRDPQALEGWWLLGHAALASGDMPQAAFAFSSGADHAVPGSVEQVRFHIQRVRPLIEEGRMADAVAAVRAAVAGGITEVRHLVLAASTLTHAGLPAEARPLAQRACEVDPASPDAWYALGGIEEYLGARDAAEAALQRAIAAASGQFPAASVRLAQIRRWTATNNHVAALTAVQCQTPQDAARIAYALFKECDDLGNTEAAWHWLQRGAAIMRQLEPWSSREAAATVEACRRHLPSVVFADAPEAAPRAGPRRIFVLGLPRSGTTLVERILAAHPTVHAMGEPKAFAIAVRRLVDLSDAPLIDADVVERASKLDPALVADFYTREMAPFDGGRGVTIDKRTQNTLYVGLIRRAFPDAAIVAVERDPMDALFGSYKRLFAGSHNWSYHQDDLADHYRQHRTLIDHWASIPAIGLIRIRLEDLIANPNAQIRRLLDACGLTFDAACLRPHEAAGAVMTASATQVRDPINATGIGAWRRYRDYLKPLHAQLVADKPPAG